MWNVARWLIETCGRRLTMDELAAMGAGTARFFEASVNIHYNFSIPPGFLKELFKTGGRAQILPSEVDDFALITLCGVDKGFRKGTPWLVGAEGSGGDMGGWRGVTLEDGRVVSIDWSHQRLRGELNPIVRFLTKLRKLDVNMNSISGGIPAEIGECRELQELNASFNKMTGELPMCLLEIGTLTSLNLKENIIALPNYTDYHVWDTPEKLDKLKRHLRGLQGAATGGG
jgi:hypothetical protein